MTDRPEPAGRPEASPEPAAPEGPGATGSRCAACGHGRQAHEHYRRGSDCALCDCPRFRSARPWFRWLRS